MRIVEPKALVRKLTPTGTRILEQAVGRASTGGFYEIIVEHLLAAMLEPEEGDTARIFHHFQVDRPALLARVEKELQRTRTGNAGRPVISERVFTWMEEAWLLASVELGYTRLRTGHLLVQLLAAPDRYLAADWPELGSFKVDQVKRELEDAIGPSPESREVEVAGPGGAVPAAATGGEALARFTINFTQRARDGKIDRVFGRDREIRQLVDVLARRRKNNPIIVGEPGVGKTALVEGLAIAIVEGTVPETLHGVELLGLDLGALQAGASVRGEFENRLKSVLNEVKGSPKPIVLFIDEAHTLVGGGAAAGGGDAANLLKPELARGELRTIAATTWSEYKKYFEKDAALERRFQPVKVDEPSDEDAILMLRGLRSTYEAAHGVVIRDEAVVAAVRLSRRYLTGRHLPDKAVDLLDTAAARVKIALSSKPESLVAVDSTIASLERERESVSRDLAQGHGKDEGRVASLDAALGAARDQQSSMRARLESERAAARRLMDARTAAGAADAPPAARAEVDAARAALASLQGEEPLIHTEVDAAAVAQVVSAFTGVPVGRMRTDQLQTVLELEKRLADRIRGQPQALRTVGEVIRISHAGVRNPGAPVGVLLFVGTSGVGKTETAIALADLLYGGERFMTTINMSEFQEKHTVSRLIGSPPGYVGYGEGGRLTEAVRQRPYSVVLLDEVEKADPEVMNLFYQVFDKGVLTDGEGRDVDFKNTLMILTTNLASDVIMRMFSSENGSTVGEMAEAIRPVLSKRFQPALLARMTVVPFAPLPPDVLREVVALKLSGIARRLRDSRRLQVSFDEALTDHLVARCADPDSGARAVEHVLRGSLMPALSRALLERVAAGESEERVQVGIADDGGFKIEFAGATTT